MFGFFDTYLKFFGLNISYYGLIIAFGMGMGIWLACVNCKKRRLTSTDVLIVACYIIPLALIGAKFYYVIFSGESFVDAFLDFRHGWAIYGGVIGGALAIALYCLIHKKNFFDVADIVVVSLILGQAIGRIGCYFGGCCFGVPTTQESLMWFPMSVKIGGVWHLATMFYESAWNFATFAVLMVLLYCVKFFRQRGSIGGMYLILYGIGRAWIEGLRGDSLYIGSIKVSQLLSILLIAAGIALILGYFFYFRKHPPVISSAVEKSPDSSSVISTDPFSVISTEVPEARSGEISGSSTDPDSVISTDSSSVISSAVEKSPESSSVISTEVPEARSGEISDPSTAAEKSPSHKNSHEKQEKIKKNSKKT